MNKLFEIPEYCPICSRPTIIVGDFLYCRSKECPSRLSGSVKAWIRNFGLLHWGDAMIDSITDDRHIINSVADLYSLSVADLSECCSGIKMAQKCHAVLHANKSVSLDLVLSSLNIPNFGLSTASDIVRAGFDTVGKVLTASFDDLKNIKNIGHKTALQIQEGLVTYQDVLLELEQCLDIHPPSCGIFHGKNICITGELSLPRKAIEKMIMEYGGFPKGSVSKDISYLVCNNSETTSSKMLKAKKYGINIINEEELMKLLNSSSVI